MLMQNISSNSNTLVVKTKVTQAYSAVRQNSVSLHPVFIVSPGQPEAEGENWKCLGPQALEHLARGAQTFKTRFIFMSHLKTHL